MSFLTKVRTCFVSLFVGNSLINLKRALRVSICLVKVEKNTDSSA